jgi:ribonuclease BN (tRNA processing enzyme)
MNIRLVAILGLMLIMVGAWVAAFVIYRAAAVGELVSPLETRQYESLTVVTVGTGGGYENPERMGPTTALAWGENIVLVDVGRGVAEALRTSKIPVAQPRTIVLTNLLPLNTMGLDDLLFTGWQQEREGPLRILGPVGTAALVAGLTSAYQQGGEALGAALALPAGGGRVEVVEVEDGYAEELDGVRIMAGALPGGPLPALAWRFERGRRSVVVSGTGWASDALVAFAKEADLLVHEGVYIPPGDELEEAGVVADPERLDREAAIHTALQDVGDLARQAAASGLILVRLRPPPFFDLQVRSIVAASYDGDIYVPKDGDEILP